MRQSLAGALLVAMSLLARSGAAQAALETAGSWRLVQAQAAPWAHGEAPAVPRDWIGQYLVFDVAGMRGPGVLSCDKAVFGALQSPFEGLFQGGLPAPAEAAAQALGIAAAPVAGLRVDCANGSFDFHAADTDTLLFALDNVIWTLSRSAGTAAAAAAPEAAAQALLERHFGGDMGFSPAAWANKRDLLDAPLDAAIERYFAQPQNPDEVPAIDGDPLTDSQEYPTRFSVGAAHADADCALVPVRYSDAWRNRDVELRWCRKGANWKLNDVLDARGGRLSGLLAAGPD